MKRAGNQLAPLVWRISGKDRSRGCLYIHIVSQAADDGLQATASVALKHATIERFCATTQTALTPLQAPQTRPAQQHGHRQHHDPDGERCCNNIITIIISSSKPCLQQLLGAMAGASTRLPRAAAALPTPTAATPQSARGEPPLR